MKNIILLLSILLLASCSFAINPPAAVQKAFTQKFAGAADVKWGKENGNEYEAEFVMSGIKMSANFDAKGNWLETETEMAAGKLPAKVTAFIAKTYPGWKITEAGTLETPKKGLVYEADLKSGKQKKEITLTADGEPVR